MCSLWAAAKCMAKDGNFNLRKGRPTQQCAEATKDYKMLVVAQKIEQLSNKQDSRGLRKGSQK